MVRAGFGNGRGTEAWELRGGRCNDVIRMKSAVCRAGHPAPNSAKQRTMEVGGEGAHAAMTGTKREPT